MEDRVDLGDVVRQLQNFSKEYRARLQNQDNADSIPKGKDKKDPEADNIQEQLKVEQFFPLPSFNTFRI